MPIQVQTADNGKYVYYPLNWNNHTVAFKVKALCNGFVTLSNIALPTRTDPVFQVLLGISSNKKSAIGINGKYPYKADVDTPSILSCEEFRGFWIYCVGNTIQVGKENEVLPFLSWSDAVPINVNYFGVCSGYGVEGEWLINGETIRTPGSLEYVYRPVRDFHLEISVQAEGSACIAFTSGPHDTLPMYQIALGAWHNKGSAIRYSKDKTLKAYVDTPGLLSSAEPRQFTISCNRGLVLVSSGSGSDDSVLMEWQDPKPFNVTYFGVRTANGATGIWTINVVNDLPDSRSLAWVPGWNAVPDNSVLGAEDGPGGESEYVGRYVTFNHKPAIEPGKVMGEKIWYTFNSKERSDTNFEYLTGANFKWVQVDNGKIPPNAVVGGCTMKQVPLYVGRHLVQDKYMTIGRVNSSDGVLSCPRGGTIYKFTSYEILVQI